MHRNAATVGFGILFLLAAAGDAAWAQSDTTGVAAPAPPRRESWVSGFQALKVGDLVTVVITEETSASEKANNTGTEQRNLRAEIGINTGSIDTYGLNGNWNANTRVGGESTRQGVLSGVVGATVIAVNAAGVATIEGKKTVTIDGRPQETTLRGLVRPQDLFFNNVVYSDRLADATITYKGKKMGPKYGVIGKVLSIVWPF